MGPTHRRKQHMQSIFAYSLLLVSVMAGRARRMVAPRLAMHPLCPARRSCAWGSDAVAGWRPLHRICSIAGACHLPSRCSDRPRRASSISLQACYGRLNVHAVEPQSSGRNHLGTERVGRGARAAAIPRVLDAMDDGRLAVMAIGGFGRAKGLVSYPGGVGSRVRAEGSRRCQDQRNWDRLLGRFWGRRWMGMAQGRVHGWRPIRLIPFGIFIEPRRRPRELGRIVGVVRRRLRGHCARSIVSN
jgi:hypothetical protein